MQNDQYDFIRFYFKQINTIRAHSISDISTLQEIHALLKTLIIRRSHCFTDIRPTRSASLPQLAETREQLTRSNAAREQAVHAAGEAREESAQQSAALQSQLAELRADHHAAAKQLAACKKENTALKYAVIFELLYRELSQRTCHLNFFLSLLSRTLSRLAFPSSSLPALLARTASNCRRPISSAGATASSTRSGASCSKRTRWRPSAPRPSCRTRVRAKKQVCLVQSEDSTTWHRRQSDRVWSSEMA